MNTGTENGDVKFWFAVCRGQEDEKSRALRVVMACILLYLAYGIYTSADRKVISDEVVSQFTQNIQRELLNNSWSKPPWHPSARFSVHYTLINPAFDAISVNQRILKHVHKCGPR
jgi:hypothetical protein